MSNLLKEKLQVINMGIPAFSDALKQQGIATTQLDWRPPAAIPLETREYISSQSKTIEQANQQAVQKLLAATPHWVGMGRALDKIPGMKSNLILHSGPPISWQRMCGPMQGGVIAALIYEGMAQTADQAHALASSGEIEFAPCHHHGTVGPMAGIVSASMPVFVVKNESGANCSYATMNEGLGKVLRYGAYDSEVIERLKWMERELYPALQAAIEHLGKIDLKSIIAQALHMVDEVHNRNRAATSLLYRHLAPAVIESCSDRGLAAQALNFINGNDHFFLNLSMAACKASLDSAGNTAGSSLVTVMARNGVEFGVQLAGCGDQWFVGKAPLPDALFFPGFSKEDANPDIGDSSITETCGLGGFAIAASPAIVQFVGGKSRDAIDYTLQMYEITIAENSIYQIPALDFRGTPTGIDVAKVVEKSILPFIDTGVAHKEAGVGQVGAGVLSAPMEPFLKAYQGLAEHIKTE